MSTTYQQLGQQIGALTDEKNAAYGSSFAKAGDFLRLLYPDGVSPEQADDALLLVRIFDKQMRIATDKDALGESPYQDIAGYGLLGAMQHAERKRTRCGTASTGADDRSTEPSDSAAKDANEPTTTTVIERSEQTPKPPSTPPSPATSASTAASAPSATVSASASEVVLLSASCDAILTRLRVIYPSCSSFSDIQKTFGWQFATEIEKTLSVLTKHDFIAHKVDAGYYITRGGIDYWFKREGKR